MDVIRNGRVAWKDEVRDIMLPAQPEYTFDFSRYKRLPRPGEPVDCSRGVRNAMRGMLPALDAEEDEFWNRVKGYDTGHSADETTNQYTLVRRKFAILREPKMVFAHPSLEDITAQVGISSLTPFLAPSQFGLPSTDETLDVEVAAMNSPEGRTAAFEKPVRINGKPYLLEVKGVNFGTSPILPGQDFCKGGECAGGLTQRQLQNTMQVLKKLNANGYESELLIAAYVLPIEQFDRQRLGAYVRAVPSSPPVSHFDENLPDVASSLRLSNADLAEYIISSAARDVAIIWRNGFVHDWIHQQNVRIGGLSDLTGAKQVFEVGFAGVARDVEMLVGTSQRIMRKLIAPSSVPYASSEMHEQDSERAAEQDELAVAREYVNQTADYCKAREIISSEVSRQLGVKLPLLAGTTTFAAHVYDVLRDLDLTNPAEKVRVQQLGWKGNARFNKALSWKKLKAV